MNIKTESIKIFILNPDLVLTLVLFISSFSDGQREKKKKEETKNLA